MGKFERGTLVRLSITVAILFQPTPHIVAQAISPVSSRLAASQSEPPLQSTQYVKVQARLAQGWNTWDVHSVATQVLLPGGLAIHVGIKHNTTLNGDAFLANALIGRLDPGAEIVTPGPHAWDGSYTSADFKWKGHEWRIQSAHEGGDLVLLVTPLKNAGASLPATAVFSVNFLWNSAGTVERQMDAASAEQHRRRNTIPSLIRANTSAGSISIYCTCDHNETQFVNAPVSSPYFAADLTGPLGLSTRKRRSRQEIQAIIVSQKAAYEQSIQGAGKNAPILDAIETTLGWDTIYDPEKRRVFSPVSRVWSVGWGGYVLFDWDTFFAATMASIGDKDLAYANALETLREETPAGFVPNYVRAGDWKSFDRSEPPVGAITVLGLYRKFHDTWFLRDAFEPLLRWNRWWAQHRALEDTITLGSDPDNQPRNPDDKSVGTWQGAVYESGLDNSPMYDGTTYNPSTHLLEYADVGMTSLYIADCDALAEIAGALGKSAEAAELKDRADHYRAGLAKLWNPEAGIFENRNLHTNVWIPRLSPTNFYPLIAKAATPEQAKRMIEGHLMNPDEFWGEWIMPSIARHDPAFKDQEYWRGRIWGPMNYLVYLGLLNYDDAAVRKQFAEKGYALFLEEWKQHGHVHENYNAITGSGDDVSSSDRFYHWGALLGYIEYLEQGAPKP
jgi:putative isomerase